MAASNLPFAASATRRAPTTDELANGFDCGDADRDLFNWMAWYPTAQISTVLRAAGLTPQDNDATELLRAIRLLARTRLTADKTVYVSPSGSNSNDGTTAGTAFQTIQFAYDFISKNFDLAGFEVTIQCAAGTYNAGLNATGAPLGQTKPIKLKGANPTTGAGTTISVSSGQGIAASNGAVIRASGFTVTTSGANGHCVFAGYGGIIYLGLAATGETMVFGSASGSGAGHIVAGGGQVLIDYNYTVTSQASFHYYVFAGTIVTTQALTAFFTAAMTFTIFCSVVGNTSAVGVVGIVYSLGGAMYGKKFAVSLNGVINTQGAGVNLFPGDVAGTTAQGGQYA